MCMGVHITSDVVPTHKMQVKQNKISKQMKEG